MKARRMVRRALLAGAGLATGRIAIDLLLEPKAPVTVAVFAAIAFGVGFLGAMAVLVLGGLRRTRTTGGAKPANPGYRR